MRDQNCGAARRARHGEAAGRRGQRDRQTLYAEIAKANGHPEWEGDIRKTFARRWVERGAKPGWYYQDAGGSWKQK